MSRDQGCLCFLYVHILKTIYTQEKNYIAPKSVVTEKLGHNATDILEWVNSVNVIEDLVSSPSCFPSFPRQLILAHYGSLIGSRTNLILLGEKKDDYIILGKINWLMTMNLGLW